MAEVVGVFGGDEGLYPSVLFLLKNGMGVERMSDSVRDFGEEGTGTGGGIGICGADEEFCAIILGDPLGLLGVNTRESDRSNFPR